MAKYCFITAGRQEHRVRGDPSAGSDVGAAAEVRDEHLAGRDTRPPAFPQRNNHGQHEGDEPSASQPANGPLEQHRIRSRPGRKQPQEHGQRQTASEQDPAEELHGPQTSRR